MQKFHCNSKRMRFGYTNFVNYINLLVSRAKKQDKTSYAKLVHCFGFVEEIWENPDGSKEIVYVMESNASLWDYWYVNIMTESERVLLFEKRSYDLYNECRAKIENK